MMFLSRRKGELAGFLPKDEKGCWRSSGLAFARSETRSSTDPKGRS